MALKDQAAGGAAGGWLEAAAILLFASVFACGCAGGSGDKVWTRPSDLEPQLETLVDAQLALINKQPTQAALVGRLGVIYEANRRWSSACEAFDAAFALAPEEPLWLVHAALARTNLGDPDGALSILQERESAFTRCAPLQFALGEMLLDSGEVERAAAAFDRTIAAAPKLPEGHAGRALVELRLGHAEKARELLVHALELDPSFRQAWYPLGLALRELGREAEALAALERGREVRRRRMRDPLNADLALLAVTRDEVLERSSAMIEAGRGSEALAKLEPLARSLPDDGTVQFNVGVARLSSGKFAEALTAFERARVLDEHLAGLDVNLAVAYLSLGKKSEAALASARAIEREAHNTRAYRVRAMVCEALGDGQAALQALQRAVQVDVRDADARAELGRSFAQMGQWSAAEEQFRAQVGLVPNDWRAHSNLARVLSAQGRKSDAQATLQDAERAAGADAAANKELRELAAQIEAKN